MYNPLRSTTIVRIISAQGSTRPSTLSERIQTHVDAIARMEATDFPGKAETLAAKRAMLAEMEKALGYVETDTQADKVRKALRKAAYSSAVAYPVELYRVRRRLFVQQINERGQS